MDTATPLVELRDVRKVYGAPGAPDAVEALRGVSLTVLPAAAMAIVGPSGSGKSTLLNILGALDAPTGGDVLVGGRDLLEFDEVDRDAYRGRTVGFVFQRHYLLPSLTVLENVLVPALPFGHRAVNDAEERARTMLGALGLDRRAHALPGTLSVGERQRAAVVRALINRPQLILADEPTGALDHPNAVALIDILMHLREQDGAALIVVTHAAALARRLGAVCEMRDGRLVPWVDGSGAA